MANHPAAQKLLASLCFVQIVACEGSPMERDPPADKPSSQRTDSACPITLEGAKKDMRRYVGTFSTRVRTSADLDCDPEADTVLRAEIRSSLTEAELDAKPCGAAWLPVSIRLTTDDGAVDVESEAHIAGASGASHAMGSVLLDAVRSVDPIVVLLPQNRGMYLSKFPGVWAPCCKVLEGLDEDALGALSSESPLRFTTWNDDEATPLSVTLRPAESPRKCAAKGLVGGESERVVVALRDTSGTLVAEGEVDLLGHSECRRLHHAVRVWFDRGRGFRARRRCPKQGRQCRLPRLRTDLRS
ncbi:MAG: hypothetical protein RL385_5550 [Pseudomonadota bacterium]|jgi:hypothetical protein